MIMSADSINRLFLIGAIFNWVIGLGMLLAAEHFLSLLYISPLPEQSVWIQLFAALVLVFGYGYFLASRDFERHATAILLGVWGKTAVVLVAGVNVVSGDINAMLMVPAGADGVFAALFMVALRRTRA